MLAAMNARSTIDLTQFEQIAAGSGTVLLRVAAAASAELSPSQRPILIVDDGERRHRLAALPAPPDPVGVLRAAYSAPVSLVQPGATFSLELPGGAAVALPTPSTSRQEVGDELAEERRLRQEAEQHADTLRAFRDQAATERKLEVDRLRAELAAQAERAAAVTAALQAGVEIARAEASQHRDDAEHVRSQLEQAQAAATGAERRAAERAAELAHLRDQADTAREATAEAKQTASERAAEMARLRSELERHTDAAAARASELQAQVEIVTAEADEQLQRAEELQAEVERVRDAGERRQAERDQRLEQVEAELQRVRAEGEQAL